MTICWKDDKRFEITLKDYMEYHGIPSVKSDRYFLIN